MAKDVRPMARTLDFTVPAAAGTYAPEVLYLGGPNNDGAALDAVRKARLNIAALPAGAVLEIDLLKVGGDPKTAADWRLAVDSASVAGLQPELDFGSYPGVRLRMKSGGTAGTGTVDASWEA